MMQAGQLDQRITIQALTDGQDAYGHLTQAWSDLVEVWAQYMPGAGNEKYAAAGVYAETQGRFRMRWRAGITVEHRVRFDGRNYDILAVDEIGRRDGLELKVKAAA